MGTQMTHPNPTPQTMNSLKSNHFVLNSVTVSKKLNFAYEYDSANLEDKVDQYKYSCHEEWHPDFAEVVKEAVTLYAERLGFDTEADQWLAFHPKKIYVKGLLLKIDFEITVSSGEEIEISGIFLDGMGEIAQQITGEARAYINGSKRKQGDLFERKDVFVGQAPEEYAPEEPEMEEQAAESDLDHAEEQREPALV